MFDLVSTVIGEYTLMCLILVVISVFLNNFVPPIQLQYRFIVLAICALGLAHYLPPNDTSAYGYAFVIAGVVCYKDVLLDEIRLITKLSKKQNDMNTNTEIREE